MAPSARHSSPSGESARFWPSSEWLWEEDLRERKDSRSDSPREASVKGWEERRSGFRTSVGWDILAASGVASVRTEASLGDEGG